MANKTMTRKLVKKNAKPEVKYDYWMMEHLKKNKKEAFEYLKASLEENADCPPAFHYAGFPRLLICRLKLLLKKPVFQPQRLRKCWAKKGI